MNNYMWINCWCGGDSNPRPWNDHIIWVVNKEYVIRFTDFNLICLLLPANENKINS